MGQGLIGIGRGVLYGPCGGEVRERSGKGESKARKTGWTRRGAEGENMFRVVAEEKKKIHLKKLTGCHNSQ